MTTKPIVALPPIKQHVVWRCYPARRLVDDETVSRCWMRGFRFGDGIRLEDRDAVIRFVADDQGRLSTGARRYLWASMVGVTTS